VQFGFTEWTDLKNRTPTELHHAITKAKLQELGKEQCATTEAAGMNDAASYDLLTDEQKGILREWIRAQFKPAETIYYGTSYGMKQPFTSAGMGPFYVTNGQFKGAMRAAGFEPVDPTEQNWRFRVALKINDPKPGSFLEWLLARKARNSPFGDLASDAADDRDFPPGELTKDALLSYMRRRNACSEALDVASLAWRTFTRSAGAP
jgi:hypothetical protein